MGKKSGGKTTDSRKPVSVHSLEVHGGCLARGFLSSTCSSVGKVSVAVQ